MAAKKWEQYLWEKLHIVPVPDFNTGRISLLDIFAQDGRSYRLRNVVGAGDGKPFRRRRLTRIGSMLTLGNDDIPDWPETREDLQDELQKLKDDDDDYDNGTFETGIDGPDRKFVVDANSGILGSLCGFATANVGRSATFEVHIRFPSYQRVAEDELVDLIDGGWKPDLQRVAKVKRKDVSFWGTDEEELELWIVTELKFAAISYSSTKGIEGGVEGSIPDPSGLAALILPAAGAKAYSSKVSSREVEASTNNEKILYGFKAVRVTFDKQGNYVGRRGDMGKTTPHVTRDDEENDLNPDVNPKYHMSIFFDGDEDGDLQCVELDYITEENMFS